MTLLSRAHRHSPSADKRGEDGLIGRKGYLRTPPTSNRINQYRVFTKHRSRPPFAHGYLQSWA